MDRAPKSKAKMVTLVYVAISQNGNYEYATTEKCVTSDEHRALGALVFNVGL